MKRRPTSLRTIVHWRTMRSAPKDRLVFLAEEHNSGDGTLIVCFGRYVNVPYTAELNRSWQSGGTRNAQEIPCKGRWLASHVAILEHGGACTGNTVEEKMYLVHPKYWAECPKTP